MSVRATRMPSAMCPGLMPNTDTISAVITNQAPSTPQLKSGVPIASVPATNSTSRYASAQSMHTPPIRLPSPATE